MTFRKYHCENCGNDTFYLDEKSMKQGDEPTEAKCAKCGYIMPV